MARSYTAPNASRPAATARIGSITEVHFGLDTDATRTTPHYFAIKAPNLQKNYQVDVVSGKGDKHWSGSIVEVIGAFGIAEVTWQPNPNALTNNSPTILSGTETLDVTVTNNTDSSDTQSTLTPAEVYTSS
jgi:hypothetical protein